MVLDPAQVSLQWLRQLSGQSGAFYGRLLVSNSEIDEVNETRVGD